MTPTDKDMERAEAHVKRLEGYHLAWEYEKETASLIAQVRKETLDAAEAKLAGLEKFYANRNGVKTESEVGRIIGVQDAMLEIRNLKQEDKE